MNVKNVKTIATEAKPLSEAVQRSAKVITEAAGKDSEGVSREASSASRSYASVQIKKVSIKDLLREFESEESLFDIEQAREICTDADGKLNKTALAILSKIKTKEYANYALEACQNREGKFDKTALEYLNKFIENGCQEMAGLSNMMERATVNGRFDETILKKMEILTEHGISQPNFVYNKINDLEYYSPEKEKQFFEILDKLYKNGLNPNINPKCQNALLELAENGTSLPESVDYAIRLTKEGINVNEIKTLLSTSLSEEEKIMPEIIDKAITLHNKGMNDGILSSILSAWKNLTQELPPELKDGNILSHRFTYLENEHIFNYFKPNEFRDFMYLKEYKTCYDFSKSLLRSINNIDKEGIKALEESGTDINELKKLILDNFSEYNYTHGWNAETFNKCDLLKVLNETRGFDLNEQKVGIIKTIDFSSLNLYDKHLYNDALREMDDASKEIIKTKYGIDIDKMLESLGKDLSGKPKIARIPKAEQKLFWQNVIANNNPKTEEILRTFDFSRYERTGIPLKYSQREFMADIDSRIGHLPQEKQAEILEQFGITRTGNSFDGILDNSVKDEYGIKELVDKFTLENETLIEDPEAKTIFDSLIRGLPGFVNTIGRAQHEMHQATVDIHSLRVLQSAMNDPMYQTLSGRDKTVLKFSTLLHDIGKKSGIDDTTHDITSANFARGVLDDIQLPERLKRRVINNIRHHEWFAKYSNGQLNPQDVAVIFRYPGDLKIAEIMTKADFTNVNKNFHLQNTGTKNAAEFNEYMENKFKPIEEAYKDMRRSTNVIFDSQFHDCSKFPVKTRVINGKEYRVPVLDLYDKEVAFNLEQYGFAPGVTKKNVLFTVHMTGNEASFDTAYRLFDNPMHDTSISQSLIKFNEGYTHEGKSIGYICDNDMVSVAHVDKWNSDSGFKKNFHDSKKGLFYNSNKANLARMTPDKEEQFQIMEQLADKRYPTQVKDIKIGDRTITREEQLRFDNADYMLSEGGQNERVTLSPGKKAVAAKGMRFEEIPDEYVIRCAERGMGIVCI